MAVKEATSFGESIYFNPVEKWTWNIVLSSVMWLFNEFKEEKRLVLPCVAMALKNKYNTHVTFIHCSISVPQREENWGRLWRGVHWVLPHQRCRPSYRRGQAERVWITQCSLLHIHFRWQGWPIYLSTSAEERDRKFSALTTSAISRSVSLVRLTT